MRTKAVTTLVTLTLAAGVLAGCGSKGGSGASGNYCSDLKADKAYFAGFSGSKNNDFSQLDQVFSRLHTLAGEAPSDVSSDWKTLDGALTTLQNALKQAGIKPSDLASMQSGKLPPGVDLSKLQALAPKLQALSSTQVSQAANNISKNAKDSCGVDLTSN